MKKRLLLAACVLAALAVSALFSGRRTTGAQPRELLLLIDETGRSGAEPEKAAPTAAEGIGDAPEDTVKLLDGDTVVTLGQTAYLTGVVLSEMPPDFAPEALKAQAIAARTFFFRQREAGKHAAADVCSDSACCQAWTSPEALRQKFGGSYDAFEEKAAAAVEATEGEVLEYGGELIDATYFSCSGGATEDAAEVWGSDVPYLQSVPSPGEQDAARYSSSASFGADELLALLGASGKNVSFSGDPGGWVGETSYTQGGGVAAMRLGGAVFTGVELRKLLGLNSTKFQTAAEDGRLVFRVLGYGHRVGMSQYGAEAMAEEGFSCGDILRYYYRGADIKSLSQTDLGQAGN